MKGVRWVAVVSLLLVGQLAVFGGTAAAQTDACGAETCDRAVLEALYDATDGASWTDDTSWKTSAPLDEWRGWRPTPTAASRTCTSATMLLAAPFRETWPQRMADHQGWRLRFRIDGLRLVAVGKLTSNTSQAGIARGEKHDGR